MEKESKNLENLLLYKHADVAGRLLSNEETAHLAKGALEKLDLDIENYLGDKKDVIEGYKAGAFASKEGAQIATSLHIKKYQEALGKLDITEFYDVRKGLLKKAEEYKNIFEKYKGQTVGSILKTYMQAQAKTKDTTGLFDEKQKEEAKKTIEKLEPMYTIINLLEQRNYFKLINGATESTFDELIDEAIKKA